MRNWLSRRFVGGSRATSLGFQIWRHGSVRFFEQLEDRTLLSIGPAWDYDRVSPDWFDSCSDYAPAAAVPLDFVGPLTLVQHELRLATLSGLGVGESSESQWIVRLTPEATALVSQVGDAEALLQTSTAEFHVVRGLGLPGQLLVETPGESIPQAELALSSNPLVAHFGRNGIVTAQDVEIPDYPEFSELWGLHNTGQTGGTVDADIDGPEAWDFCMNSGFSSGPSGTVGSSRVVVAVIDSGVDYTHPDLYKNIWINQGEIPVSLKSVLVDTDSDGLITFYDLNEPANAAHVTDWNSTGYIDAGDLLYDHVDNTWKDGSDGDHNGKIDDLVGWDFGDADNTPSDDSRHGTHVAGTIAAMGDNQTGAAGVAWRASIMPLKFLDDSNRGTIDAATAAINYAALIRNTYGETLGINVVANNSWGYRGESDAFLREALEAAGQAGILTVAASGNGDILGHGIDNDEDPAHAFYPASEDLDGIISVAASDDEDRLARFSNYGATSVDIAAPGVSIFSTEPGADYRLRYGTSMAAPHVSGAAALVWSMAPDATVAEVREAILSQGDPMPDYQGKIASGRRLNAYGSVLADKAAPQVMWTEAPNVDGDGVTETLITVQFQDDRLVNIASVQNSHLLITCVDDPNWTGQATFQSVDATVDSRVCTATYLLTARGGSWDTYDGDYEVSLESGQVADSSSNWAAATLLATFNVDTTPGLIRVTSTYDDGSPDTLRAAVIAANADTEIKNVIRLAAGQYTLNISGRNENAAATGDLDITHDLEIRGAGADRTTIDAAGLDRVLHILQGVSVELVDIGLIGGDPQAEGGGILNAGTLTLKRCEISGSTANAHGGGLANAPGATASVIASTFYENTALLGGAIGNQGTLTVTNSTVSANTAAADGGGIHDDFGDAAITNTTITNNTAYVGGGVVSGQIAVPIKRPLNTSEFPSTIQILNTIIAGNSATIDPDFAGEVNSLGTNLIGSVGGSFGWVVSDLLGNAPLLGPLQNNTGTTRTHALLEGSPAIDAGTLLLDPAEDQRGITRPVDGDHDAAAAVDIGAVERYFSEVHGILFNDENGNGFREFGEAGIVGEKVFLDVNLDGQWNADEPFALTLDDDPGTGSIDETGMYSFQLVEPGTYTVAQVLQPGWEPTEQGPGVLTTRVSNSWQVLEGNSSVESASMSADGRYVVFASGASNLVAGDTNGTNDVFVHDRDTGVTQRVSVSTSGIQANRASNAPSISGNGRYVAFASEADNLVSEPGYSWANVYIHDMWTGTTEIVGDRGGFWFLVTTDISEDGRYVAFVGDGVLVYDRQTGVSERADLAPDGSWPDDMFNADTVSISGDGRYVAFISYASNLVEGDTNATDDVFVRDLHTDTTERVSLASNGSQISGGNIEVSLSADGRFVVYQSSASDIVPGDTNNRDDIFVFDRQERSTERVSVADNETQANNSSTLPSISENGRYVLFTSGADNLVANDTNGVSDAFLRDRQLGTTERVSLASDDGQAAQSCYASSLSSNARYVAFTSGSAGLVTGDTNNLSDVFMRDRQAGSTIRASITTDGSRPNGSSGVPAISYDGQCVAFFSAASDLAPGQSAGIYVYDGNTRESEWIGPGVGVVWDSDGTYSISGDGRYVAFTSDRLSIQVYDRSDGTVVSSIPLPMGSFRLESLQISPDGRYVVFQVAGEIQYEQQNVFVHDLQSGMTDPVSLNYTGMILGNYPSGIASISSGELGDGPYVVFVSMATDLVDPPLYPEPGMGLYRRNLQTGITEYLTDAVVIRGDLVELDGHTAVTPDGRFIAYEKHTGIYVYDCDTGTTEMVSTGPGGIAPDRTCYRPSISADGRYVTFYSLAFNLASDDTNGVEDAFVHDRVTGITTRVSLAWDGGEGFGNSTYPVISGDGMYVAFVSAGDDLVPTDQNGRQDVFLGLNLPAWEASANSIALEAADRATGIELGTRALPGEIRGLVFHDLDRNGTRNAGEPGQPQWRVYLDLNQNGTRDTGEPSTLTGTFGDYAFTDLEPSVTYTVSAVQQEYWVQTYPTRADGGSWTVQIKAGTVARDIEFGNFYNGPDAQSADVVTGIVYEDRNRNGMRDGGEPAKEDWTVLLKFDDGQVYGTDTTDAFGRYAFEGVPARAYTVWVEKPTDWVQTTPLENTLDEPVTLGEGQLDQTQAVTTGDFDNDGDLDLAVTHGEYVSLYRNSSEGAFTFWQEHRVGSGAGELRAGDFDNDGDLELAVICFNASTLVVLQNPGGSDPAFAVQQPLTVGALPRSLSLGQFDDDDGNGRIDSDDNLDVAIAHENGDNDVFENDNQVSILLGKGDGFFKSVRYVAAGSNPVSIVTGQFNDDNHDGRIDDRDALDLAVANKDSKDVTVLVNNGRGSFSTGVPVLATDAQNGMPFSLTAADLDRDGDLDLAVADLISDSVSILVNAGNGSFLRLQDSLYAGTGPQAVIAADIEGDGDDDLIVTNNTGDHLGILRNFTDPATRVIQFGPLESFGVANFDGGPSYSVAAAHLDSNQTLDLAVAIGETSQQIASQTPEGPQNYVAVLLNNVEEGGHHITVTGVEAIPELHFGVRPIGNLAEVVGQHIFYNNSWFDGNDPAANAGDDDAIAIDKQALLPGEKAAFENYTSYSRGINGIMVDVANPNATNEDTILSDFSFKAGNTTNVAAWPALEESQMPTVSVRSGMGNDGSDRITLTWPDNAIQQQWLQVTIQAGGQLGLIAESVFYFGNAIGDSGGGNLPDVATTFPVPDETGARANPHNFLNRAPIDDIYDYNRDSIVFISDESIARSHWTSFLTGLKLITAPADAGAAPLVAGAVPLAAVDASRQSAAWDSQGESSSTERIPVAPVTESTSKRASAERVEMTNAASNAPTAREQYVDSTIEDFEPYWIHLAWLDDLDRLKTGANQSGTDRLDADSLTELLKLLEDSAYYRALHNQ